MVKFEAQKHEKALIEKIVNRAINEIGTFYPGVFSKENRMDIAMDLEATHSNGCPLNFKKLLFFDALNFYHDMFGIYKNICRKTGKLNNHFLPRCKR